MRDAVIIFAKYPQMGKVKTRLAATAGELFAYEFYKLCSQNTFDECSGLSVEKYLFFTGEDEDKFKSWAGGNFLLTAQDGADLGERMRNAFRSVFNNGAERAVLIGTDIPGISARLINNALEMLEGSDAIIGPANDGGYYLIGLKKLEESIFENIPWSTRHVQEITLLRLKHLGFKTYLLEELFDIDSEKDLKECISSGNAHGKIWDFVNAQYGSKAK